MHIVIPTTGTKEITVEPKFFGHDVADGVDAILLYLFSACPSMILSDFVDRVITQEVLDILGVDSTLRRGIAKDIIRSSIFEEAKKVRGK